MLTNLLKFAQISHEFTKIHIIQEILLNIPNACNKTNEILTKFTGIVAFYKIFDFTKILTNLLKFI